MKRLRIVFVLVMMLACMVHAKAEEDPVKVYFTWPGSIHVTDSGYPFEGQTAASAYAWKGERVFFKIAAEVASDQEIQVSAEPLQSSSSSETIPLTVGVLAPVSASLGLGEGSAAPHETVYDRILNGADETVVHAGEPSYLWVTADTGNAPAGKYEGRITVHAALDYDLAVTIYVTPYSLREESAALDLWQYPYSSCYRYDALKEDEPFSDLHLEALKKEMKMYASAGGNRVTCAITDEPWAHQTNYDTPSLIRWCRDGSGNLWFDYKTFDAWVSLCDDCGISGMIECFSILPYDNALTIYDDMDVPGRVSWAPGTYEWKLAWEAFLYSFTAHLQENGWLDRAVLFVDERGIDNIPHVKEIMAEVPGCEQLKLGAAINAIPNNTEFYDVFDTVSVSVGTLPKDESVLAQFIAHRKEAGLETTLYNCSTTFPSAFALSEPCESVFTLLYAASRGFDGYLRWAYNAWPNGLNESADNPHFESGDTFLIYPDERESGEMNPAMSVRLCMIEQGKNDYLKYQVLKKRLSTETCAILEAGFAKLQMFYGRDNGYGMLTHSSEEERIRMMREVIRLEALLEKAVIEAAAEKTGISLFEVKEEMTSLS